MIQLTSAAQLDRSIELARQADLLVQASSIFGLYYVTNRTKNTRYTVNFFDWNGKRFAACTCPAGTPRTDDKGKPLYRARECKHLAAALGLHLFIAALRAEEQDGTSH